jgi:hypothetical protein
VSRSKLCGKTKPHFLDLRIKSYGCLKFQGEVWAGRACAGGNEKELTTLQIFWGEGGWAGGGGGVHNWGTRVGVVADHAPTSGRRPQPAAVARQPRAAARTERRRAFFLDVFFLGFFKSLVCSKGLDFLGGGLGVQHPIFLTMPPTLGSANSSKIHGEWRFHFFPKNNFLYLVHTWTFPSTVGIFVS